MVHSTAISEVLSDFFNSRNLPKKVEEGGEKEEEGEEEEMKKEEEEEEERRGGTGGEAIGGRGKGESGE